MCGIIYCKSFNKRQANKRVRKIYQRQKNRGKDGFGFLSVEKDEVKLVRSVHEHDILKKLKDLPSKEIMFHHRYPTSTDNSTKTNHPIYSITNYDYNYYLVHNGVIQNDIELHKDHTDMGIVYTSVNEEKYNDSECLLHELALVIEGLKKPQEFNAKGSMAFVMLQTDKMGHARALYYGRNYGNPLKITHDKAKYLMLASTGTGEDVDVNQLFKYDYESKVIDSIDLIMPSGWTGNSSSNYGSSYGHGYQSPHRGWDDDVKDYNRGGIMDANATMIYGDDDIPQLVTKQLALPSRTDSKFILMSYEKVLNMAMTRHKLDELDLQCLPAPDLHKLMMELQRKRDMLRAQKAVALANSKLHMVEMLESDISLLSNNVGKVIDVLHIYNKVKNA